MSSKVEPGGADGFIVIAFEYEQLALMQITELIGTRGVGTTLEHRVTSDSRRLAGSSLRIVAS